VTHPVPFLTALLFSIYLPFCAASVKPTVDPSAARARMAEFWREPTNIAAVDVYSGPWGDKYAPDPKAVYKFVRTKTHGNSPGLTVSGPADVEWSVKQGPESHVEVTMSRVLSAAGYRQPPVYYLETMALDHGDWVERATGGRFRPKVKGLKDAGVWSWQQNPFVGTKPYQGLLVILMMFDGTDVKNTNNSLYELKEPIDRVTRWFVVRDIGAALGETGRLAPKIAAPDLFERNRFITGVKNGFVTFDYHGWHQELVRDRITTGDVRWAANLLSGLADSQWEAAFRAGGFDPQIANRYIRRLKEKIRDGRQLD
jgi:hypothetical protein